MPAFTPKPVCRTNKRLLKELLCETSRFSNSKSASGERLRRHENKQYEIWIWRISWLPVGWILYSTNCFTAEQLLYVAGHWKLCLAILWKDLQHAFAQAWNTFSVTTDKATPQPIAVTIFFAKATFPPIAATVFFATDGSILLNTVFVFPWNTDTIAVPNQKASHFFLKESTWWYMNPRTRVSIHNGNQNIRKRSTAVFLAIDTTHRNTM